LWQAPLWRRAASTRLQRWQKERADRILLEIQLPTIDGYETMRRIRTDPALLSNPIIAVSSYAPSEEQQKARAAGCDDFVPKPYSPHQLLMKIRNYLH
jgi:two-component system, cell cycle response regulator DivK